jgi:hypothetical protein
MIEAGKAGDNKQIVLILSLGYVLTGLMIAYFYFSPTLINSLFSDILIVLGVLLLFSSFIYASIKAKGSGEVALVLLGIILLSILARSIPHLRLSYPPLVDPYYYAISTLNIIDYGTLQPVLGEWYSGISSHLHWPVMQLLTAGVVEITGIDSMWLFRFQEPLLGGMFALAVFALAKEATKHNGIALLSALFASASDVVIFYQSEYHPQGFAVIFFVLFLCTYLISRTASRRGYRVLALVCLAIFLFSHHFSSLFVALLAISFIGLVYLVSSLSPRAGRLSQVAREMRADYTLWAIVAIAGLSYHFLVYAATVRGFLGGFIEVPTEPGAELLVVGTDVPMLATLLNSAKWGILLLAVFAIIRVIRNPQPREFRLLVLLACILIAGFVANYILWGPVDRMIVFYAPLVSIFAAMTVHKLFTLNRFSLRQTQVIKAATLLIVGLLLVAGFANGSHIPALYFKSSQVNSYYWYSNQLPKMDEYKVAGEWTGRYIPSNLRIGTGSYIRKVPFFFGKRSLDNVIFPVYSPTKSVDYIMSESSIPATDEEPKELEYDRELSKIYDNGELKIYELPR